MPLPATPTTTLIHAATSNTTFITSQAAGETWYYYAIITQMDRNKILTSPIWVTKTTQNILPVSLLAFKAALNNRSEVILNWQTSFEQNSDHFEVERSTDLVRFESIGIVMAKGTPAPYSFTDVSPVTGVNYYRLKQLDKDGHATFSTVVSVNLNKSFTVLLWPNPTTGMVTVKTGGTPNEKSLVQVIDIAGNMVYNKQYTGNSFTMDLSSLPAGTYVVRIAETIKRLVITR